MYRFILPALLLIGGTAALSADSKGYEARRDAEEQARLAKALTGLVPGKPQSCLYQSRLYDTERYGDTILYKRGRGNVVRVDTDGGCFGLRDGDAIVTRTTSGEFCRGDILETVDLTTRRHTGACSFGDFVPYRKP